MSWHDPARSLEPATDAALREELRTLLGVAPRNYFESEASPGLILLADDLRREAIRRNHTARKKSSWMLLAAALPIALAVGGVGAWGLGQKHKADALAATNAQNQATIRQMMAASQPAPAPSQAAPNQTLLASDRKLAGKPKGKKEAPKELVIPVERTLDPLANDTQRVKGH